MNAAKTVAIFALVLFWITCFCQGLGAEERLTAQLKQGIDEIVGILNDSSLQSQDKKQEKKARVISIVDRYFDWKEISRRSLSIYWGKRTEEERKKFVCLFRELLEKTYIGKIASYAGEKNNFLRQKG